jgi:hypothetical protein
VQALKHLRGKRNSADAKKSGCSSSRDKKVQKGNIVEYLLCLIRVFMLCEEEKP